MSEAEINLTDPHAVADLFDRAAEASLQAACRVGSIDRIEAPAFLIATGDLHDHPDHLSAVIRAARLGPSASSDAGPAHLTLHEIIHSERLVAGVDLSHRALARVARLKCRHPEHVHVLLANHELAQLIGAGIVKEGVRVVEAFEAGLEYVFGPSAPVVAGAIARFIRALPLALRCTTPRGDILCAHSLPDPALMERFDPSVLERPLTDDDYRPRWGSAHIMVWGRGYDAELIEDLVERWGVTMFILGHEHVAEGIRFVPPCAVVINSDHDRGVYLPVDLSDPPLPRDAPGRAVPLGRVP